MSAEFLFGVIKKILETDSGTTSQMYKWLKWGKDLGLSSSPMAPGVELGWQWGPLCPVLSLLET
jgi:hypothetical protein